MRTQVHCVNFWLFSQIAELEESMKTFDEETKDLQLQHEQVQSSLRTSLFSLLLLYVFPSLFLTRYRYFICVQAQTTLKVYNMNSDRLQRNLETAREENTLLQESNAQVEDNDTLEILQFQCLPILFSPEQPVHILQ